MTILFENVLFLSGSPGATTKRTEAARWADIINVKDYGAKGDGSTDDTAAIQAAVTAMYAVASKSCILYFPPGNYIVSSTIDISNANVGSNFTSGIIRGSGRYASTISGTLNSGFILSQTDSVNGPEEISNLGLVNSSTVIGTGALMINNSGMRITDCNFQGMINVLMPFNIFNANIENCTGSSNSDVTTGHTGTFGIAGYTCKIGGWRTTSPYQAAIQLYGANSAVVEYCGNENCTAAVVAGMSTGWASQCTVSGNVLTVGGNLGSSNWPQFVNGAEIFMKGLTTTADWGLSPVDATICTITETHTENPSRTGQGFAGTYTISRSATVASPVPCVSRYASVLSATAFNSMQSEACYDMLFVRSVSACTFSSISGGSTPVECVDAFGNTGYTARSGIYVYSGGSSSFINCSPNNNPYLAAWYFDPSQVNHLAFINCAGEKLADNVTGTSSSISNGSGGSGTVLNVVSYSGSTIGIGMQVTVGGVSKGKVIGNNVTDGTLTGTGGTGTYRLDTSNLVTGSAITIHTGDDWVLPTATAAKTGLEFFNCTSANLPAGYTTGLNSLNRTFTSLPGQAGANSNFPAYYGMEYDITDSNTATWGATVAGGGSNKVRVRYNGTNWTVVGA